MSELKQPETAPPPAPAGLSERSCALWQELTRDRIQGVGRLLLFEEALRALDKAEAARALVKREGITIRTESTGAVHANPAVGIEKDAVRLAVKIFETLGLDYNPPPPPPKEPRPLSQYEQLLTELSTGEEVLAAAVPPKRKRTRKEKVNA